MKLEELLDFPDGLAKRILLLLAVAFFLFAGVSHFKNAALFVAMVPPYLPAHSAIVYISGVFEVLGGLGLLLGSTRQWAGWGLIALLVAVYPANIYMASNPELFPDFTPLALYVRLPFQFVFMGWVWWVSRPQAARPPPS